MPMLADEVHEEFANWLLGSRRTAAPTTARYTRSPAAARRGRSRPHRLPAVEPRRLHGAACRRLRAPLGGHHRRSRPARRRWEVRGDGAARRPRRGRGGPPPRAVAGRRGELVQREQQPRARPGSSSSAASDQRRGPMSAFLAEMAKWRLMRSLSPRSPARCSWPPPSPTPCRQRQGSLRPAARPQAVRPVHGRRRRRRPLRDPQPLAGEPRSSTGSTTHSASPADAGVDRPRRPDPSPSCGLGQVPV